jgi:hypothetical protein
MNLGTQTDAASPPKESRRPSLMNRLSTEFGRVCRGRHICGVRRRGHTSVCRRHGIQGVAPASAAGDTSTCEGGLCLS